MRSFALAVLTTFSLTSVLAAPADTVNILNPVFTELTDIVQPTVLPADIIGVEGDTTTFRFTTDVPGVGSVTELFAANPSYVAVDVFSPSRPTAGAFFECSAIGNNQAECRDGVTVTTVPVTTAQAVAVTSTASDVTIKSSSPPTSSAGGQGSNGGQAAASASASDGSDKKNSAVSMTSGNAFVGLVLIAVTSGIGILVA